MATLKQTDARLAIAQAVMQVRKQSSTVSSELKSLRLGAASSDALRPSSACRFPFAPAHGLRHSKATKLDYALAGKEVVVIFCKPGMLSITCPKCNSGQVTRSRHDGVLILNGLYRQDLIIVERCTCKKQCCR